MGTTAAIGPCVSIILYAPLASADLVVERKRRMQQVTRENRGTKFVKLQMRRVLNLTSGSILVRQDVRKALLSPRCDVVDVTTNNEVLFFFCGIIMAVSRCEILIPLHP